MRYIDGIKTLPLTDADNSLILGTAIHTGIEKGVDAAIKEYCNSFPIIDDLHINEIIKLEYLIPRVRELLPEGLYEIMVADTDFIGFIDLLVKIDDETYDLYDFKYSNNTRSYIESAQLHLYKYFYEKQTGNKIRNMYFVFVPKIKIKQKKDEDLYSFRKRLKAELEQSEVKLVQVEYDYKKVIEFMAGIKKILETKEFPKEQSHLCNWCEYQDYCEKGVDYMLLPENKRRNIEKINKKVIWLYGAPFSGKTFLANKFPDPLMLNTDGNIKFVDAPYISIKDQVKVEGRQTKRTLAWDVFKEVIAELEKKQNDFKTIVVDLLEDIYEHCRYYIYEREGISHESDDSFKAWDMVRTEFLSTLKRLLNLDYENFILISHEDRTKDITKKTGDKITSIKPNLQDKVATKVAGMVDIVARVVADGNERTLSFKTNEVIFGGGRLNVSSTDIPLDYDELMKVYEEANLNVVKETSEDEGKVHKNTTEEPKKIEETEQADSFTQKVQETEPASTKTEEPRPERKTRKRRGE
jgi:phage nucleotide-binding protein